MPEIPIEIDASSKENVANKSTNVNTDQASNTKYPSVKAVFDWATSLFIKKSDYTPAHSILAQQSGTGSPTAVTIGTNEILGRLSSGGSTIEGLSVSQVKDLLDLENTNTGDETQASILSKLGWWNILDQTAGTVSSGTTNTITKSIALPSVPSVLNFRAVFLKTGGAGTFTARAYLSDVDNNIGGTAILIGTITSTAGNVLYLPMKRTTDLIGGNAIGLNASQTALTDDFQTTAARLNTAFPTGTPLYLIFAVQCANGSDSARFESCMINNFTF